MMSEQQFSECFDLASSCVSGLMIRCRIVRDVRLAIAADLHPKLNKSGSSGSYLAKDTNGDVVGVFKPKDEEPCQCSVSERILS